MSRGKKSWRQQNRVSLMRLWRQQVDFLFRFRGSSKKIEKETSIILSGKLFFCFHSQQIVTKASAATSVLRIFCCLQLQQQFFACYALSAVVEAATRSGLVYVQVRIAEYRKHR